MFLNVKKPQGGITFKIGICPLELIFLLRRHPVVFHELSWVFVIRKRRKSFVEEDEFPCSNQRGTDSMPAAERIHKNFLIKI